MPNYPDVPFAPGDLWTPELGYLAFHQVFDDQTQYLGHRPRITDSDLSSASGQLKDRFTQITDPLKVSVVSGLTVTWNAGAIGGSSGNYLTITSSNLVLPDNSTVYIYIDSSGTVTQATRPPVVRRLLAQATTAGGAITSLIDLRALSIRATAPDPGAVLVFGGQATTDLTCTQGQVLDQGLYYCRDFTVPAGISITISGGATIKCSGKATIQGTVTVSPLVPGGTGIGSYLPNGYIPSRPGSGYGGQPFSSTYGWGVQPNGSGGAAAYSYGDLTITGATTINAPAGGTGGGGLRIEAALGVTVSGTVSAKGGNATNASLSGVSGTGVVQVTGAAGGSGGCVVLASPSFVTVSPGATVDLRGGNGSRGAATSGSSAGSGGGGAGGVLVLFAPTGQFNTTGASILLTGGSGGTAPATNATLGAPQGASFMSAGGSANNNTTDNNIGGTGLTITLPYAPLG